MSDTSPRIGEHEGKAFVLSAIALSAVAEGNITALLPANEKLHAFACASGSSGKPKILPLTDTWLRQYQKQWRIGGTIGYQSAALEECFGAVPLRDIGYISTEGRHTITLDINDPSSVLVSDAFYEFQCMVTGNLKLASELDEGGEYAVIVTTANGLYRVRLDDIVRCTEYAGELPRLLFIQKTAQFSDIEGEKISALQISDAVMEATRDHSFVATSFSTVADRDSMQRRRYVLLIETSDTAKEDCLSELARKIDEMLIRMNAKYE